MRLVPLFLLLSVQRMRLEACFFVKTIKRMPDCFYRLPQIFINIHTRKFITKRRTIMKDKIFGVLQRVGRSFMLPIAILPVAGLLLGFGGSFTNETMLETYGLLNVMGPGTIPYAIFQVMSEAGNIVFANLPIIFAMGVAIGMAKKEKEVAALSAAIAFFIMHASISAMITINGGTENMLEGATTSVVGITSLQMGVFGGIIVGLGVSSLHNRFYKIELPQVLSFFGGTRFVPIISSLVYTGVGILMFFIWPVIQTGIYALGAAVPPDVITGGVLGAAFAISTGKGADVALALAFPIATLYLVVDNVLTLGILPFFLHKADNYIEKGDFKGMERMHILGGFVVKSLPRGIICAVAFYLGTPVMNRVLEAIPEFVQNGLVAAAGFIPALGIALLAQMILSKKTMVYFILGFALAAYLKIPMLGIAMMAGCLAVILVQMQGTQKVAVQEVEDDDDF